MKYRIVLLALPVLAFTTFTLVAPSDGYTEAVVSTPTILPLSVAPTTTVPVYVSGVVRAADQAVIAAQVAGPIERFAVYEGAVVAAGQLLAQQSAPVVAAEQALRAAQRQLTAAQHAAAVDAAAVAAEQAMVVATTTDALAVLATASGDAAVREALVATLVADEASTAALLSALQFVNTNRSLFPADALVEYERIVSTLYGRVPPAFAGGILRPLTTTEELQATLAALRRSPSEASVVTVANLHALVETQLRALTAVLVSAEGEVFDQSHVATTDARYQTYLTERAALISAQAASVAAGAQLRTALDAVRTTAVETERSVSTTELDAAAAARQVAFGTAIAEAAAAVADAGVTIAATQAALAEVRAPFAGVVVKRFVRAGEYATPGTPLLLLSGVGGRELEVTLPGVFASSLRVGQTVWRGSEPIGVVSRFSAVGEHNAVPVTIALTVPDVRVGETVTAELHLDGATELAALPRAYLSFTSEGPVVQSESGALVPVTVEYDAGKTLYIKADPVRTTSLLPFRTTPLQ